MHKMGWIFFLLIVMLVIAVGVNSKRWEWVFEWKNIFFQVKKMCKYDPFVTKEVGNIKKKILNITRDGCTKSWERKWWFGVVTQSCGGKPGDETFPLYSQMASDCPQLHLLFIAVTSQFHRIYHGCDFFKRKKCQNVPFQDPPLLQIPCITYLHIIFYKLNWIFHIKLSI